MWHDPTRTHFLGRVAEGERRAELLPAGAGPDRHVLGGHQEGVGRDAGRGHVQMHLMVISQIIIGAGGGGVS